MTYIEFFPYPLILGLLILTLVAFRLRKRGWLYLGGLILFGLYLLLAFNRVLFPIVLPDPATTHFSWAETADRLARSTNLIPFNYGGMFAYVAADQLNPRAAFWEIAGNILLTIPFGLGLAFLTRPRGRQVLWLCLAPGLLFEGLQFLLKLIPNGYPHAVDINDVILNALGAWIGYGLYRAAGWGLRWLKVKTASIARG